MRRLAIILSAAVLFIGLTGCASGETSSSGASPGPFSSKADGNTDETAGLRFVSSMGGAYGTSDGYYFIRNNHQEKITDNDYGTLMYIDYKTKRAVPLCSKGNCAHSNAGCTSYLQDMGGQGLFVYGQTVYRLSDAVTDGGAEVPGIVASDVDGSNRRMVYRLDSGMAWLRDFAFGNGMLYADTLMYKASEENDMFMTGSDEDSRLLAVDLISGKGEVVCDLSGRKLVGVKDDWLILTEVKDSRRGFLKFNPADKSLTAIGDIPQSAAFAVDGGKVYFAEAKKASLSVLNLADGRTASLASGLPASPDTLSVWGGYVLCSYSDVGGCQAHFSVPAAGGEAHSVNLMTDGLDFAFPVSVKAAYGDRLLVITGVEMATEYVPWVGVWQDYIAKEKYALIATADFMAGRAQYETIAD